MCVRVVVVDAVSRSFELELDVHPSTRNFEQDDDVHEHERHDEQQAQQAAERRRHPVADARVHCCCRYLTTVRRPL